MLLNCNSYIQQDYRQCSEKSLVRWFCAEDEEESAEHVEEKYKGGNSQGDSESLAVTESAGSQDAYHEEVAGAHARRGQREESGYVADSDRRKRGKKIRERPRNAYRGAVCDESERDIDEDYACKDADEKLFFTVVVGVEGVGDP